MDRARIHEGIRRMRFTDVLGRSERSELSQMEAAELLGISERTFRRWRDRHRDAGLPGLEDRRLAPSLRRAPVAEIERMLGLYRDLYRGLLGSNDGETARETPDLSGERRRERNGAVGGGRPSRRLVSGPGFPQPHMQAHPGRRDLGVCVREAKERPAREESPAEREYWSEFKKANKVIGVAVHP